MYPSHSSAFFISSFTISSSKTHLFVLFFIQCAQPIQSLTGLFPKSNISESIPSSFKASATLVKAE